MSGVDLEVAEAVVETQPARKDYGSIVVVGGGCYGSYYVRQLLRARAAGALSWEKVLVIDRNPDCAVAATKNVLDKSVSLVTAEWKEFFDSYLSGLVDSGNAVTGDAIVPSPLMPHLMYEWLLRRAQARWPHRHVNTRAFDLPADFPWASEAPDGTRYVSFATWTCPVNCVEPRVCPHTRGARSWSIPDALRNAMSRGLGREGGLKGPVIFHCTHRAYGVGMIDASDVVAADRFIGGECTGGGDVLIGTTSHCHGALNVLSVSS